MMKTSSLFVLVAAATALGGCASKVDLAPKAPVETRTTTPAPATGSGAGTGTPAATGQSSVSTVSVDTLNATPAQRVVYFDFDSFVIKDEFKPTIDGHAKSLANARNKRIVVEGHTDERGGREYNLALGQKRAEAVVRSLVLLGVAENQIEAVSFGEERPAQAGSDESAWGQNRRAELKDR